MTRRGLGRLRAGEWLVLLGAVLVVVSLFAPWYEGLLGQLDPWNTFGPAIVLLLAALCAALATVISALSERTTALPIATAIWTIVLGLAAVIAMVVRVLERPEHARYTCFGVWLALAGAIAILAGAWLVIGDERPSLYEERAIEPRPRP
jgi:peptidoglycan/LPS O-acetylase OafA/YrhL